MKNYNASLRFGNLPKAVKHRSKNYRFTVRLWTLCPSLCILYLPTSFSVLVVAGAEGAAAPVNFERRVHATGNFCTSFLNFCGLLSSFSKLYSKNMTFLTKISLPPSYHLLTTYFFTRQFKLITKALSLYLY